MMEKQQLPSQSVVFVKGGQLNPFGWKPTNPNALNVLGDDDHPGYSDSQLSESLVAKVVDADCAQPLLERFGNHHHLGRLRGFLRPRASAEI